MRYTIETYSTGHQIIWDNHTKTVVQTEYFRTGRGLIAVCERLNHEHALNVNDRLERRAGRRSNDGTL